MRIPTPRPGTSWLAATLVLGAFLSGVLIRDPAPLPGLVATALAQPAEIIPPEVVSEVHEAMPAVVNISTTRRVRGPQEMHPFLSDPLFREFFGDELWRRFQLPRERLENSLGSGVIIDPSGLIVTNYHVVEQAEEIQVLLDDGREFKARVVGADPMTDLAVVKVDGKKLPSLQWGDSDQLRVAETVFAIGNPFGLDQTVTSGIISALGRANVGIADYEDFIQTDAAINPGNSGGALINTRGELVGVPTAIFSQTGGYLGIGFAVPSNMAREVVESLVETGRVVRGWLGVSIQNVTTELARKFGLKEARGVLVSEVLPGSPAAAAGLRPGDIIVGYNGEDIDNPGRLRNLVAQTAVGTEAKIRLIRDGKTVTVTPKIAEQPQERPKKGEAAPEKGRAEGLAGLEVRELTPEIASQLGLQPTAQGVVVTAVDPASGAALAGLQPGDVITEINRKPVRDIEGYRKIVADIGKQESVLLLVNRGGAQQFVVIER